jgi:hypothetical protein
LSIVDQKQNRDAIFIVTLFLGLPLAFLGFLENWDPKVFLYGIPVIAAIDLVLAVISIRAGRRVKRIDPNDIEKVDKIFRRASYGQYRLMATGRAIARSFPCQDKPRQYTPVYAAMQKGTGATAADQTKPISDKITPDEAVDMLVSLYDQSPRGEGFVTDTLSAEPIRGIGRVLYKAGGMESMLNVHAMFAARRPQCGRNLEMVWHGIGEWRG